MRYLAFFILVISSLFGTVAFAEVDPAVLSAILSKLSADTATGATTSTGATATGTNTSTSTTTSGNNTSNTSNSTTTGTTRTTTSGSNSTGSSGTSSSSTSGGSSGLSNQSQNTSSNNSGNSGTSQTTGVSSQQNSSVNSQTSTNTSTQDESFNSSQTPTLTNVLPTSGLVIAPSFKVLKVETGDGKATFTFRVVNDTAQIKKFELSYTDEKGLEKKALTKDKNEIRNANGEYVWYIPGLEMKKYTVAIAGATNAGEVIPGVVSAPVEADLSLASAGKCIIPNVSGLKVLTKQSSSILYWDRIPEAMGYRVYKKNTDGKFVFIKETQNNSYAVQISSGPIKFEEFSIKGLCSDGSESVAFSPSTSMKTGPGEIVFLGLISSVAAFFIIKRKEFFGKA